MARIERWLAVAAAFLAAVFAALFFWQKAGREKDRRVAVEGARKTERKAGKALIDGLQNEQEAVNEARRRRRRDHFKS